MNIYEFFLALSFWQWVGIIALAYMPLALISYIIESLK
jgi:hypothetical protein